MLNSFLLSIVGRILGLASFPLGVWAMVDCPESLNSVVVGFAVWTFLLGTGRFLRYRSSQTVRVVEAPIPAPCPLLATGRYRGAPVANDRV